MKPLKNLELPNFKQGSILCLKLATNGKSEQDLTGTCLKKRSKGLYPPPTPKYPPNSTNEPIIQTSPVYPPFARQTPVSRQPHQTFLRIGPDRIK